MPVSTRIRITAGGVATSILLHGLLFAPMIWGTHQRPLHTPNTQGATASRHDSESAQSLTVFFMDDTHAIQDPSQDEDALSYHLLLPEPKILLISQPEVPDTVPQLTDKLDSRPASEANGDQAGRALLFGRYMGQISARVERAWMRPRSSPGTASFACRVQITQDTHGNVEEVTLQECGEDPRWQLSLVQAINAASPLPAPPDPAVFSNLLTLEFDSDPYVAGGSDQGFEPVLAMHATTAPISSSESLPVPGTVTRRTRADGSIDLTIVGSQN